MGLVARVYWGAGQAQGTEALGRGGSRRNVIGNEVARGEGGGGGGGGGGGLFKNLLGN